MDFMPIRILYIEFGQGLDNVCDGRTSELFELFEGELFSCCVGGVSSLMTYRYQCLHHKYEAQENQKFWDHR